MKTIIVLIITALFLTACYVPRSEYTQDCRYDYHYKSKRHRVARKIKICKVCDGYSCWKEIRPLYR